MLFAVRCTLCSAPGRSPCEGCARTFDGSPIVLAVQGAASAMARYPYDGELRRALLALKYANARASAGFFAAELAGLVDRAPAVVSFVPTSAARRRQRGFDQAELIARQLARRLGVPARALLRRMPGPAQTGRSRAERRKGPRFQALGGPRHHSVLLIDDVATTLATASAAASTLAQLGAVVHVRTVAATPRR